jgi:hypothetical protein
MNPQPSLSVPPSGFDPAFTLNVMIPLAEAAYAVMQNPGANPPLPAGFQQTALLQADETQRATLLGQPSSPKARIVGVLLKDSGVFGLIGNNPVSKTAFVSFRGTQTPGEWLEDFDALFEPYEFVTGCGSAHQGFQSVCAALRDSARAGLAKAIAGCNRLLVTGHSLGAALAVIAAVDIAKNLAPGFTPEVITFAGPASGLPDFAHFFDSLIPSCYRVVNQWDIVPRVPLQIPFGFFQHTGTEKRIDGGFADVKKAHSLSESYVPGLRKLLIPRL